MPIVAGIGGNSGNQTITMIVRGLALGQIASHNMKSLLQKELGVSLLNGLIWGSVLGLIAFVLYQNPTLSVVMTAAMTLNLLLAAVMGVAIPLLSIGFVLCSYFAVFCGCNVVLQCLNIRFHADVI